MAKRILEYVNEQENSAKWWEVEITFTPGDPPGTARATFAWGRCGSAGQTQVRVMKEAALQTEVVQRVEGKLREGYRPVERKHVSPEGAFADARRDLIGTPQAREQLLARLKATPDPRERGALKDRFMKEVQGGWIAPRRPLIGPTKSLDIDDFAKRVEEERKKIERRCRHTALNPVVAGSYETLRCADCGLIIRTGIAAQPEPPKVNFERPKRTIEFDDDK